MNGLLIGCQNAIERRISAYNRFRDAQIIGVWDPDADAAQSAAASLRSSPQTYDKIAELTDALDVDFIDLAMPIRESTELIERAAAKRLSFIFDSASLADVNEARALQDVASDARIRVAALSPWRYFAHFRALKKQISDGWIGQPLSIRHVCRPNKYRIDDAFLPNGSTLPLLKDGVRQRLDTVRFLFGEPDTIYCRARQIAPESAGEDMVHITLGLPFGATYTLDDSTVPHTEPETGGSPTLVIEGTDGALVLRRELHHSIEFASLSGHPRPLSYVMPVELAQDAFSFCLYSAIMNLNTDANETSSVGDVIKTMQLVGAAYESAASGQAIRLERDDDSILVE